MNSHQVAGAIPFAAVALLCFVVGYRIRVRGDVQLIAGYDPARVRDPAGLGRWFGGVVLGLGGVALAAALAQLVRPSAGAVVARTFAAVVLATAAALVIGARRYTD